MTEIILSEITRMQAGRCVIGLLQAGEHYRSVRPLPSRGHAWPGNFPYHRGDRLQFFLSEVFPAKPHLEDRPSTGVRGNPGRVPEEELVRCLRQAEMADRLKDLFGCPVTPRRYGHNVCTEPGQGTRSICGCDFLNLCLRLLGTEVRAKLILPSGETLHDLPLVDRDWNEFIEAACTQIRGANQVQRLNRFLTSRVPDILARDPKRFARIGLSRPYDGGCWLMLDSLFPLPQQAWLEHLK
jgi:hypothetical protein